MMRVFVALPLPEEIRGRLADLGGGVPGARWVDEDNLHLTLRFIGEVDEGVVADIDAGLTRLSVPAFELTLAGIGQFGSGSKARALWVGIERSDALAHLKAKVDTAVMRAGLRSDERKFAPHVTIARLRDAPKARVARFVQERALFRTGPIPIDRFALFESSLGGSGAIYDELRVYPLLAPVPGLG